MKFETFVMERTLSIWEHKVDWNLSESGVTPLTLGELVEGTQIDDTRLSYPQTNGTEELRERAARTGEAKSLTIVNPGDKYAAAREKRDAEDRARRDQYELQRIEAERARGQRFSTIGQDRGGAPGLRTIRCGNTMITCEPRDTVMCGGRPVPCQ